VNVLLATKSPVSDKYDFIASEILPGIAACAEASVITGGSFLITILPRGLLGSEAVELVSTCFGPLRQKIRNEAVRVHFNSPNCEAATRILQVRLASLIGPFIEGVGHIRVDETPEGVVIVLLDNGRISGSHNSKTPSSDDLGS
jgi:hypothetical protein